MAEVAVGGAAAAHAPASRHQTARHFVGIAQEM
jgi:hypothetical protein